MALAAYSTKLRVLSYELEALCDSLGLEEKIQRGEMTVDYARSTSFGGSIDRLMNALGCQIATVHRLYDAAGNVARLYPESIVIGDVLLWRLGHQQP
jgi:hypothetical protein